MIQLTARMIRSYKGAAASILLLFIGEGRPLTQGEMRRGTGYGDEAINDAVWMLREDGWLVETGRYTWTLSDGLRQLPLAAEELPADIPEKIAPDGPELESSSSSSDSLNPESSGVKLQPLDSRGREPELKRLEKALDLHGIRNPARGRLLAANYEYEFVLAHLLFSENTGQAIFRIEHEWPIDREKWRFWWSYHCPDCLQERVACECEFEDEEESEELTAPLREHEA